MRLSDGTSIDEWIVRAQPQPAPPPPISPEEARLMRLEAALAEVGARLEGLQLPPPQVNVPPMDLSEVVQAVAGIKSSDPDAIADAIAARLQFPEPVPTDLSALTDLRSVLEKMEHRLTGIGNQAFGSSGPSNIADNPSRALGKVSFASTPTVITQEDQRQQRLDYDARTDGNPVYVGIAASTAATDADVWTIYKLTYDASARLTLKQVRLAGSWDDRAVGW